MHTGLFHEIDFEKDQKWSGHLGIPFSIDRSPYYQLKIPIFRIKNGAGPKLLLMAGNHGDEYEGELSLARLVRRLDPKRIKGRVTILPMANAPAVMAAKRCSPLDGGNLNRAFPGDPSGTPTSRLAHFLETELFARHDVVFDIHSGGTSMEHLPTALVERNTDPERHKRGVELMRALGMPYGFIADNGPASPTSMGAARRAGSIGISGEFGGGGTTTPESMAFTTRAIDSLMMTLGITTAPLLGEHAAPEGPTELLSLARHSQGIFATRRGWWEPAVELGARVTAGDLAGWCHNLDRLTEVEERLHFAEGGVVISCRLHTIPAIGSA